jgi:hypothetical protein
MKTIKIIDWVVQAVLIVGGFVYGLIIQDFSFVIGYFIVGGWQVLSFVLHCFMTNQHALKSGFRKAYGITLLILLSLCAVSLVTNDPFFLLFIFLLFFSPLMAIGYCYLCFVETKYIADEKG